MKEIYGDAWVLAQDFDVLFITSNGTVKKHNEGVMGRGIAAQAKYKYPIISRILGEKILRRGNVPSLLLERLRGSLWSFPVKHEWHQTADISLIVKSCHAVLKEFNGIEGKFLLPRPGCGNGGLRWEDVKKVIEPILDDRFYIVHFQEDN
jgi:hypothetical protein